MATVAQPISINEVTNMDLRPMRSPKWPITIPPMGRATNPTARVAKAARVPARSDVPGKNCLPSTSAAAVP